MKPGDRFPNGNTVEQVGMVTMIYDTALEAATDESEIDRILLDQFDTSIRRHQDFVGMLTEPVLERERMKWVENYHRDAETGEMYGGHVLTDADDPDADGWRYTIRALAERAKKVTP